MSWQAAQTGADENQAPENQNCVSTQTHETAGPKHGSGKYEDLKHKLKPPANGAQAKATRSKIFQGMLQ